MTNDTNIRDSFSTVNPVIAFIFFAFALIMPMLLMHPVLLGISFLAAVVWLFLLRGKKALPFLLKFVLPIMLLTAILNPIFNHGGMTTLFYFRNNPITLEAILYGAASAFMLGAVVTWFSCFNAVFTADRIIYLTGRFAPSLSLVISMALRFVPLFTKQAGKIALAQRGAGMGTGGKGILNKAKNGLSIFSGLITWALESSVTTADSMRARGYGLHPRRSFANYRFDGRDAAVGLLIAAGILAAGLSAGFRVFSIRYFPSYRMNAVTPLFIGACAVYALTLLIPTIMYLEEAVKWRLLRSRI